MTTYDEVVKIMNSVAILQVRLEQIEAGLKSIQRHLKKLTEVLYEEMQNLMEVKE